MADEPLLGNGGAAAVITQALGKLDTQLGTIVTEQVAQRDLLTRFDERQRGWATKHEVTDATHKLELALAPVAAQAQQAHVRLDTMVGSLATLGTQLAHVADKLDTLIMKDRSQDAEVRGAWAVIRPTLAWVAGISAAFVAAFTIGRWS